MTDVQFAPNPIRAADAAALIGWLAVYEGALAGGSDFNDLKQRLRVRLERDGLLVPDASDYQLRQAVNNLNHRLRYVLGEYDSPPDPLPLPDWLWLTSARASACLEEGTDAGHIVPGRGKGVLAEVAGRQRK